MMSLTWILPLLAIWPLLRLLRFSAVARSLMGLRFTPLRLEGFPFEELPHHFAELSKRDVEELSRVGFSPRIAARLWDSHMSTLPRLRVECANADATIRAIIAKHPAQILNADTRLILESTLDNGDEFITASHDPERLLPVSRHVKMESIEWATVEQLLARHTERLADAGRRGIKPVATSAEEGIARELLLVNEARDDFAKSGKAALDSDGKLHWRFFPALRKAWEIRAQSARRNKATKAALLSGAMKPRPARVSEESQNQFDWEVYTFLVMIRKGKITWASKTLLMLASLVLFCLALGWSVSWSTVLIIVGVLVFHEGGHLLGMRLFGYRDTQLLFLPFLGGVAVGRDAVILKPWQSLVMLFMGPLPGLFIGVAMMALLPEGTGWAHELADILVFLNAFNLLPFLPLDGGQIMDTVFIGRFPYVKVVFTAVSGAALILVSLALSGGTLLIALGAFMLLRIPAEWRTASLLRLMRRAIPADSGEEPVVRRLILELRKPKWSKTPMMQRIALASALQARLRQPSPNWAAVLLAVVCYTSPVWLGLGILGTVNSRRSERSLSESHARGVAAGLASEVAEYAPKGIPDSDNAAVPLEKALEKIDAARASRRKRMSTDPLADANSADNAQIVALLADAAARPGFEPRKEWLEQGDRAVDLGHAIEFIANQAAALRKLHDPNGALSLSLAGLRLEKHLQTVPAQWSVMYHATQTAELWSVIEESLADEQGASPDLVSKIAAEIDLPATQRYSRQAILLEGAAQERRMKAFETSSKYVADQGFLIRAIMWYSRIAGSESRMKANSIESSLRAKQMLDGIDNGVWPAQASLASARGGLEVMSISMLAQDMARLRMANTALAICWQGLASGSIPANFSEIRVPWWNGVPHSPIGGAPLGWTETRGVGMLAYSQAPADAENGEEGFSGELDWRLPPRR
jgi:Zn-dependent protease